MREEQFLKIKEQINLLLQVKQVVLVGIDGTSASGKTTLAKRLAAEYDCNVFHMDDFFLQLHQRTEKRRAEIGGNVDYERFGEEVIQPLLEHRNFQYRPYDCHLSSLKESVTVLPKALNIIEGAYALHPNHASAIDLSILLTISEEAQRARIIGRNPDNKESFFNLWIPMERSYLEQRSREYHFDLILPVEDTIFEYKRATIEDIDELVRTRIVVLRAANKLSNDVDMSEVEQESYEYYKRALASGEHVAYLVYDEERFVGAGGVSFYQVMPTYHNPSGKNAYIMNMYTAPEYRRQGIAYRTLDLLVEEAKERGVMQISLEATEAGRPLYEKYGFVKMDDEMELGKMIEQDL